MIYIRLIELLCGYIFRGVKHRGFTAVSHRRPHVKYLQLGFLSKGWVMMSIKESWSLNQISCHAWDWYIYLRLVDFYGKCKEMYLYMDGMGIKPLKMNSSPLKNDGWKTAFFLGRWLFTGELLNFGGEVASEGTPHFLVLGALILTQHPFWAVKTSFCLACYFPVGIKFYPLVLGKKTLEFHAPDS